MLSNNIAPVSVIIPCYRCAHTIQRAVQSIAQQTQPVAQVLLVDDASDDHTPQMLQTLQTQYPQGWLQIHTQPTNQGPASARNLGWQHATQPYIAFLDADDVWHPQKIAIQYRWMAQNPNAVLSAHAVLYNQHANQHTNQSPHTNPSNQTTANPTIALTNPAQVAAPNRINPKQLLLSNRLPTRSVMLKANVTQRFKAGRYHGEDYLLWLQICLTGQPCYRFNIPLATSFKAPYGECGLTANLWQMEQGELQNYALITQQGLINPVTRYVISAWSLLKFCKRLLFVTFNPLKTTKTQQES